MKYTLVLLLLSILSPTANCEKRHIPSESDMAAYLMVYHKDNTHSLHMAISHDGYTFTALNDDKPVVKADTIASQKGIRDPHIFRGPDGAFYVAMTDLHLFAQRLGYRDTRWERDEKYGWGNNRGLVLMKSWDLINWQHHDILFTEVFDMDNIGCVWAPEITFDEEKGEIMLHCTMRFDGGPNALYYTYVNEDFDSLEMKPQLLFQYPNEKINAIDSDIIKFGDQYILAYVAHDGTGGIKFARSNHANGPFEYDPRWYDLEPGACEAPNIWKRIGENKWVMMYDIFSITPHNFGFIETEDFVNFKDLGHFNEGVMKTTNFTSPKHGAVVHITADEARKLEEYWNNKGTIASLSNNIFDIVTGTTDGEKAYLRLPRDAEKVNAILYTHQNMTEEVLFRSPFFTNYMDSLGVAMAFIQQGSQNWDIKEGCQERFENIIQDFALSSGHPEIATAPIIPFGHSAQATFPWNFAAWNPDRTLCIISYHGDAPRTNLCGYGRENVEWGRTRNIDSIPALMVMGEYEWWENRLLPAMAFKIMYPQSRISFLCDAGKGHFDLCNETQLYMAQFIEKALKNPRPANGVMYSRWFADNHESDNPYEQFWYQDQEMVDATRARYMAQAGKKERYVSALINGELIPYNPQSHIKLSATLNAQEFEIVPVFVDESRTNILEYPDATLRTVLISGPAIEVAPNKYRVDPEYFGFDPKRLWSGITLCIEADGNEQFKSAVQELNIHLVDGRQ